MLELTSIFAPLVGFLMAFLFGKAMGDKGAQLVTCFLVIAAAIASCIMFVEVAYGGQARTVDLMTWISSGALEVKWALRFDTLSVVMMAVVTIVSSCVHVYSIGYMSHDAHKARFMAYLSLFTFAMIWYSFSLVGKGWALPHTF